MNTTARPVLNRIMRIDEALRRATWPNANTLAKALEVNPRTIRRDLDFLRDRLRAPIAFDARRHGYYYTEASYRLPFLQLTEGELVALFLAEQMLRHYYGTPYGPDLERAFDKITAGLNERLSVDVQTLSRAISFRTAAPAVFDVSVIKTLVTAIVEHRQVVIDYWTASTDEVHRRTVDPYHLTSCDGQQYMFGYCHMRGAIRQFAPGRIRAIELTDVQFMPDDAFRVEDCLANALAVFGGDASKLRTVRLRFTGEAVRYARERLWHPTQTMEATPDGGLLLTFEVAHMREVERLVLTWAPHCEALEPPELRADVARALNDGAKLHATTDGSTKRGKRKP